MRRKRPLPEIETRKVFPGVRRPVAPVGVPTTLASLDDVRQAQFNIRAARFASRLQQQEKAHAQ